MKKTTTPTPTPPAYGRIIGLGSEFPDLPVLDPPDPEDVGVIIGVHRANSGDWFVCVVDRDGVAHDVNTEDIIIY